MVGKISFPGVLLASFLLFSISGASDWDAFCPRDCKCKWYGNKKVVECTKTNFSTIPSHLSSEINVLDLTGNSITSLSANAFKSVNLINLHRLILANNHISSIDKDAFEGLKLVMDLDLSNNRITWLHDKTFTGMEKMRKLILSGNPLERLEAYQFPELGNLRHLQINHCRLSYINNLAFSHLSLLTSVSLRGNNLTVLQPALFMNMRELRSVQLDDNKWECDCKLRKLVSWIKEEKMGEAQLACYSPQRVAGKKWRNLDTNDLACAPVIKLPITEQRIFLGENATLPCGATGEPLPSIKWTLDGRVLTNSTRIPSKDPDMVFLLKEDFIYETVWFNLTVIHTTDDQENYKPLLVFKCIVVNPAKIIENNVSLILETQRPTSIVAGDASDLYFIIAAVTVTLLFLVILSFIIYCCVKSSKTRRDQKSSTAESRLMERNNILIVNPLEMSPRKVELYEKVPQAEIELTDLSKGSHTHFDEMNYPEERNGRVRSPLTVLEEEEFDQSSQKLLDISSTTTTTIELPSHYPDLLDNVRFPRAVSPTQLSYHSLVNPLYSPSPEWRYSYVYPSEYSSLKHPVNYNVAVPQVFPRPGYVTLPRRPRSSSVSSAPIQSTSPKGPVGKLDPIYDTLGPRTTADGTSRTDLTRAISRNGMDPVSPTVLSLPKHYIPTAEDVSPSKLSRQHSKTLPRSSPNLLEDKCLSLPQNSSPPKLSSTLVKQESPLTNGYVASKIPTETPKFSNISATQRLRATSPQSVTSSVSGRTTPVNGVPADSSQKKKVPPKPPPKPVNKRLSIASSASDAASRKSIAESEKGFQDEGPDGTEV